jgi:hypothetical protein
MPDSGKSEVILGRNAMMHPSATAQSSLPKCGRRLILVFLKLVWLEGVTGFLSIRVRNTVILLNKKISRAKNRPASVAVSFDDFTAPGTTR